MRVGPSFALSDRPYPSPFHHAQGTRFFSCETAGRLAAALVIASAQSMVCMWSLCSASKHSVALKWVS